MAVLCSAVYCSTVHWIAVQCSTVQCSVVQCSAVPCLHGCQGLSRYNSPMTSPSPDHLQSMAPSAEQAGLSRTPRGAQRSLEECREAQRILLGSLPGILIGAQGSLEEPRAASRVLVEFRGAQWSLEESRCVQRSLEEYRGVQRSLVTGKMS